MINFVLSKLLRDRFCDVIFLFPELCIHGGIKFKKIKCHKILLSVFSDYFKNLFNFDSEKIIIINGYSYEVFKMMIDYIYDNNLKIDFNDSNFLLESLQLSDEYMLTKYKIVILDKIKEEIKLKKEKLPLNNYIDYLISLINKSSDLLLYECIDLVIKNLDNIIKNSKNSENIIMKIVLNKNILNYKNIKNMMYENDINEEDFGLSKLIL
tara:strand:- start:342 stop:971 length:630 start_codon:yes stop_codon:yes gene_type:complete